MPLKEPKFMKELHKIRVKLTNEWKGKTAREIVSSISKEASKHPNVFFMPTSK